MSCVTQARPIANTLKFILKKASGEEVYSSNLSTNALAHLPTQYSFGQVMLLGGIRLIFRMLKVKL